MMREDCGSGEKERKTETEVDEQCKYALETVGEK